MISCLECKQPFYARSSPVPTNCPNCGEPVVETIRLLLEEQRRHESPNSPYDEG